MSFSNPIPVAVALLPYKNNLVGIRRGIEPGKGGIALPGGYINSGESFGQSLSRELREETGIIVSTSGWKVYHVGDAIASNRILIFGIGPAVDKINVNFKSKETQEVVLIDKFTSLTFPLHEEVIRMFFNKAGKL